MEENDEYRPRLPVEAREEVENLKDYYKKREEKKKERYEEEGRDFNLGDMPWRHENNLQFKQGYIILQALKHNDLNKEDVF